MAQKTKRVAFESLEPGTFFKYHKSLYIKNKMHCATSLLDGNVTRLADKAMVIALNRKDVLK